jgi:hypothetical protein
MAGYSLGFAHGRITLSYNGGPAAAQLRADLLRIIAVARAAHDRIQRFGQQMDRMGSGLTTAAKIAGKAALGVTAFAHAIAAATVVAVNLAPVVAAAFAALPGLIAGAASAMIIFKVATVGVGDALKKAGGDSKEFQESIKDLTPQAKNFAVAWRGAIMTLKPLQKAVQDAFFKKTGPEIAHIAQQLGDVKGEAVGAADGFNVVFRRVLEFLGTGTAVNTYRATLNGLRLFLLNVSGAIQPLLTGFFNLARQAGEFGGTLGNITSGKLTAFGDFLNNVNLEEVFSRAMDVLRPLGTLLSDIGSIVSSVFSGLAVEGGSSLGVISEMVGQLAEFLKTAEGQEGLAAIGQAINAIAGATGQVFLTLLQELTPVIIALAPGISQLALAVAGVLVPALQVLGPILTSVAAFLSRNMDVIAPIIIGIYALAAAMKVYAAITRVAAIAQSIWNSALLASAVAWIRTTAATIAGTAAAAWARVVTLAGAAATWIASAATAAWGIITLIATSPITLIIIAIIALIAIIVLIATKTTWFQDAWNWAWGGIKAAAMAVWNWLSGTLWPGIKSVWSSIVSLITDYVGRVKSTLSSIWGVVLAVVGFFNNLRDSVIGKMGDMLGFIRSIPGRIGDALSGLGSLLVEKGRALVDGFIDGIRSMIGKLKDTAASMAKAVTDVLPGSPAKIGPLSGRGWTPFRGASLVEGLAQGMQSQLDELARVAEQVANAAIPLVPTAVGGAGLSPSTIPGAIPFAPPTAAPAGVVFNQTVNALPGMSATQVADYSHRKLVLGLRTGSSILVNEPEPKPAGA